MRRESRAWFVFAGCFLLSISTNAYMIAPSSIAPLFAERFAISQTAVGDIVSAAIIGVILTQIPGGYLMDRFDNRKLMLPSVVVFVITVGAIQIVELYPMFLGLRVVGGVVGGFVFTIGANVIGEVFPADRQGFATGIFLTSAPIAFVLAHTTSPMIGTLWGPLRVFVLHAALSVVGLVLFWVAARYPIKSAGTPTSRDFLRALGNRSVLLVSLSAFTAYALYLFLNTWVPSYGTNVLSLPLSTAGFVTALVPLAGIASRASGGWVSTRLGGRRRPVLAGGLLVGLTLLVAIPFAEGFLLFVVLLVAGAFALQLGTGVYFVLIRELATPGTEGTSLTLMTTVAFTGSFAGPIAGGWLIDSYSWTIAFGAFAAVGLLGVVVLTPLSEPGVTDTSATEVESDS